MESGIFILDEGPSTQRDGRDEYFCPVCGVELSFSNFLTAAQDYYCPYCATRQTPAVV